MRKTSVSRKIFVVFNTIFLCTLALLCFLPLLNLFAISLSGKAAANSGRVTFWPIDFTVMAYQKTFQNNNFVRSLMISCAYHCRNSSEHGCDHNGRLCTVKRF